MPETDQERLNRIGNWIWLLAFYGLTAVGIALIVFMILSTLGVS